MPTLTMAHLPGPTRIDGVSTVPVRTLWGGHFPRYLLGRSVSLLGNAMAPVALAAALLHHDAGSSGLGLVLAARTGALVIFLLVGGAMGDRSRRSHVLVVSHVGAGVTQAAAAALLLSGTVDISALICTEAVNGALSAFTLPAAAGILPQLVDDEFRQRANSLISSARYGGTVVGPVAGGLIAARFGGGAAIAVDSACFLIAAVCLASIRVDSAAGTRRTTMAHNIIDGWREFRSRRWLWTIVLTFAALNSIWAGVWLVLGPVDVAAGSHPAIWGTTLAANGIGIVIANVVMYRLDIGRLLGTGQLCVAALGALPLLALGMHMRPALLMAAACLGGIGLGIFGIAWQTSLQQHVPNELLSRVSAYDSFGSFVGMPLGQIAVGPLSTHFGSYSVTVAGGVLFLLFGSAPLAVADVRDLRQPPARQRARRSLSR